MDFFERWFGASPDGGNGALEVGFLMTLAAAVAVAVLARPIWDHLRGRRGRARGGVKP